MTSKIPASRRSLMRVLIPALLGLALPGQAEGAARATPATAPSVHRQALPEGYRRASDAHDGLLAGEVAGQGAADAEGADGRGDSDSDAPPASSSPSEAGSSAPDGVGSGTTRSHALRCGHLSHCLDLPPPHLS